MIKMYKEGITRFVEEAEQSKFLSMGYVIVEEKKQGEEKQQGEEKPKKKA